MPKTKAPAKKAAKSSPSNKLYYGDNIDVLPSLPAESVDLVYLDPPFNSKSTYNVLFREKSGRDSAAQIQAFGDTWNWSNETDAEYQRIISTGAVPVKVADTLEGLRKVLGTSDVMAYIVMMTPRLALLHRVLKRTGSIYLHCDPTASHYLKVVMDAIFGPTQFRNEIVWRRTGAHTTPRRFETIHDVLLFYSKGDDYYFRQLKRPYTKRHVAARYVKDAKGYKFSTGGNILTGPGITEGESGKPWRGFDPTAKRRHWAIPGYLSEQMPPDFAKLGVLAKLDALFDAGLVEIKPGAEYPHPVKYLGPEDGTFLSDIWAYQPGTEGVLHGTPAGIDQDVQWFGPTDPERLGYPTQKPTGLLERVIESSCPPDGTVLDPFCGCGTTVSAAHKLKRTWIGIDVTYLAVDLIRNRLRGEYGSGVDMEYEVLGIPRDVGGAKALFDRSPFEFERWAVSEVQGEPNAKQVGDKGSDGIIRFPLDSGKTGKGVVSVKGGKTVPPTAVRDLLGTITAEGAQFGVLIVNAKPTRGLIDAAKKSGTFTQPLTGHTYPKVQILTVQEILEENKKPDMPTAYLPYITAKPARARAQQQTLDVGSGTSAEPVATPDDHEAALEDDGSAIDETPPF